MKKFIIILSVIILLVPLFFLFCTVVLPPVYEDTFLGELRYKVERLKETEGNRIVVIGGSGAAFGIDSRLMENELNGYKIVNFGLYAGLGTGSMLSLAEPLLHSGDVVILMPEQNRQTLSDYFNPEMFLEGSDGAFDLTFSLRPKDFRAMIGKLPSFSLKKLGYIISGIPESDEVYRRASFNDYCDIIASVRESNILPAYYDPSMPVSLSPETVSDDYIEMVNEYAGKFESRGITFFYRICPLNRLSVTDGSIESFYDFIADKLDFPVLGDPAESIMDEEWFFDTNFHLNYSGAVLNSRNLVRALKAVFGDTSKTSIEIPAPPALPVHPVFDGDNSMEDCFVYSDYSDGYAISGVIDAGQRKLIVPSSHNGKPVYIIENISCSAEEIVIQENITAIYDNSFSGCHELERIIILNESPSRIQTGNSLLSGTDAYIYVPKNSIDEYKLNYFWSQYASRIRGE